MTAEMPKRPPGSWASAIQGNLAWERLWPEPDEVVDVLSKTAGWAIFFSLPDQG